MVSVDLIQGAFRAIITAHVAGVSFLSMWNAPKDEEEEQKFPAAWWGPITSPLTKRPHLSMRKQFLVDVMFLDQTANDRSQSERNAAHARMDAIATQCLMKFIQLYVDNTNTYQGVELDLRMGDARLMPVYDDGAKHLTGVRLTVLFTAENPESCLDNYFTI